MQRWIGSTWHASSSHRFYFCKCICMHAHTHWGCAFQGCILVATPFCCTVQAARILETRIPNVMGYAHTALHAAQSLLIMLKHKYPLLTKVAHTTPSHHECWHVLLLHSHCTHRTGLAPSACTVKMAQCMRCSTPLCGTRRSAHVKHWRCDGRKDAGLVSCLALL